MISNNPNRITINQGKGAMKDYDSILRFNSPSKETQSKKQTLSIPAADIMQSPSKKVLKKVPVDPCRESSSKSDLAFRESQDLKKVRNIMKDHLQDLLIMGKNGINPNEGNNLQASLKGLEEAQYIGPFIEKYLQLYRHYHKMIVKRQKTDEIQLAFNYKQSKKIFFADPEYNEQFKSRKGRKLIQLQSQNETIKKQLYKCKESVKQLQKRLLLIIQQFRQRKLTYLSEIEKLTTIIQTSIKDIPNLIIPQQMFTSGKTYSEKHIVSEKEAKTKPDNDNYNLLLRDYTSERDTQTQKIFRRKDKGNEEKGTIQRFKSQGKVR